MAIALIDSFNQGHKRFNFEGERFRQERERFNEGHKIRKLRFALRIRGLLNDIAFWPYAG